MKVFVYDLDKCNGCHNCQIACKDEHVENEWLPYAKPQPDTGQFWCKVEEEVCGRTPHVRVRYLPTQCNHCDEAPCMKNCDALYKRDDGLVILDPEKSKGKKEIVDSCPYGAIYWNDELEIPQKCTGCAHLLDDGWAVPRCVDACCTGALRFGEEEEFAEELKNAVVLQPELGTSPRVYYLNMPKRFVAATVVDIDEDEVVEGAEVILQRARRRRSRPFVSHRRIRRRVARECRAGVVHDVAQEGGISRSAGRGGPYQKGPGVPRASVLQGAGARVIDSPRSN